MRRLGFFTALVVIALVPLTACAQTEASKVRVLIVVDTLDRLGAWWGQDGTNMHVMLDKAFAAQGLRGRYEIEVYKGGAAHPAQIKRYYQILRSGPNDTLVFYYSGHGAYHRTGGHFMALTQGAIFRSEIISSMKRHKPRLGVVLTDCCANYTNSFKRPVGSANLRGAIFKEPRAELHNINAKPSNRRGPAVRREPGDVSVRRVEVKLQPSPYLQLQGGQNLAFSTLLANMDGKGARQLFFGQRGFVDINGSQRGKVSLGGPPRVGGSYFTRGLLALQQRSRYSGIDANRDNTLQWKELFAAVRTETQQLTRGKQSPEAWQLPGGVVGATAQVTQLSLNLDAQEKRINYTLRSGTRYTFNMNSSKFDTYLKLYDASGRMVAKDDDGGSGLNAELEYTPRSSGAYTLVMTSYKARGRGPFELTISPAPAGAVQTAGGLLKRYTGFVNKNEQRAVFRMNAGTTYIIAMNSKDFDTYLRLLDPSGRQVAYDDDSGPDRNSLLRYTPRVSGNYTIVCRSFGNSGRGSFVMTVSKQ